MNMRSMDKLCFLVYNLSSITTDLVACDNPCTYFGGFILHLHI